MSGASLNRLSWILIPAVIISILTAGGLYYYFHTASSDASLSFEPYTGPRETIRIGNIGEFSLFNLIAQHEGFFEKHGLDAQITEYTSGPPAMAALLKGDEDIAIAAEFVGVSHIFNNPDLRVLSQVSKHYAFQMIGRKDKGIQKPEDLAGKTIGVTRKSVGEFFLGRFLILHGLELDDVTLVDLPPAEIITQLQAGTLDAAITFNPPAYTAKKLLGDTIISWPAQGTQRNFALAYSTNTVITAHPDLITRYLRALFEAEQFLKNHDAEARTILVEVMRYDPAYVDHVWPDFSFTLGLDQSLLITMEDQAQFAINNHLTTETRVPNYLSHIYFDALNSIQPERISIIR